MLMKSSPGFSALVSAAQGRSGVKRGAGATPS